MVDVGSLRASMRRELEEQLTPPTSSLTLPDTVAVEEEGPSGFSVLRDSLSASIGHIHDAARMQLPSVHDEEDEEDEEEEEEDSRTGGVAQGAYRLETPLMFH